MDASQLWFPEILHSGPKHEFFFVYLWWGCEMLWNTSKQHFGSNGLGWMLRNFGTPKYFFRVRNMSFSSFTCSGFVKCSETLPNISFGSDGLEWILHKFWYPEIVHSGRKYEFCIFYTPKVRGMLRNTTKHHFGSNGLEWILHNFGTPK
jgi:hypothetical protein